MKMHRRFDALAKSGGTGKQWASVAKGLKTAYANGASLHTRAYGMRAQALANMANKRGGKMAAPTTMSLPGRKGKMLARLKAKQNIGAVFTAKAVGGGAKTKGGKGAKGKAGGGGGG